MVYYSKLFSTLVFELVERGEVLEIPTDNPLDEQKAWLAIRDVILGLEYRRSIFVLVVSPLLSVGFFFCSTLSKDNSS